VRRRWRPLSHGQPASGGHGRRGRSCQGAEEDEEPLGERSHRWSEEGDRQGHQGCNEEEDEQRYRGHAIALSRDRSLDRVTQLNYRTFLSTSGARLLTSFSGSYSIKI
jgi:hypothetical protein